MRKLIIILLASILSLSVSAQINPETSRTENGSSFGRGSNPQMGKGSNENMTAADSARLLIKPVMKLWQWTHDGVYKSYIKRDTSIDRAHSFNPVDNHSISNTRLSNLVSPYLSNIFIDRETNTDYLFLKVYDAYLTRPETTPLINTTTPFTEFVYKTGGSGGRADTHFSIMHTQNILPYWNAGIKYKLISGDGKYMHNKSKIYDFSLFSNYEKDRITSELFINNNIGHFEENGGIEDPKYIRDTTVNTENIPVNLMYPETHFYNVNLRSVNQYNIGKPKTIIIKKDTSTYYPFKAVYAFEIEDNQRKFTEETIKPEYYKHNYLSDESTSDKNEYIKIEHKFKFVWNEEHGSYKPGMYAGITSKSNEYSYMTEVANADATQKSTYIYSHDKFSTQYIEGGIFKRDSSMLNFDINLKYALAGEYQEETEANAQLIYNLNNSNIFTAEASFKNTAPDHNLNYYFSNHYKWENNFGYQKNSQLKFKYNNDKLNLEIGGAANIVNNYIYFASDSMPKQSSEAINIYTAYLKHKLDLGKFHIVNKFYYQNSSSNEIELPKYCYKGSYYFKNYFFEKALLLEIGADLTYSSHYYAPNYNIATNNFYIQNDAKFGDYPMVDLFVNLKIKRTNIFIKYEHLTYHLGDNNYFNNAAYPMNPAMIKYGLRWVFND